MTFQPNSFHLPGNMMKSEIWSRDDFRKHVILFTPKNLNHIECINITSFEKVLPAQKYYCALKSALGHLYMKSDQYSM